MDTVYEEEDVFMIIYRSVLLRKINFSDESCRENQNTLLFPINIFVFVENRAFNEIIWEHCRTRLAEDGNIIRRMRF
jgi:hypothetical protein